MKKTVLVIGGAGYIGSHAVKALTAKGYNVIVLDNLSTGFREAVSGAKLIQGDLGDKELLSQIFKNNDIHCIMHFAALIFVGESEKDPLSYYENNIIKTFYLVETMIQHNIAKFIFSSSAAVYGIPKEIPIKEEASLQPINPYGNTKLIVEKMLEDCAKAYGLRFASLRYFNAAGADPDGEIGENHHPENHLIPLVLNAALDNTGSISIFGTDYPTDDGTCIRDYVHVCDLVNAHILAMEALDSMPIMQLNLGNGTGFSVKEIIRIAEEVTGKRINAIEKERRKGDPPVLVADSSKTKKLLGWTPEYDNIHKIIETAWRWHQKNL